MIDITKQGRRKQELQVKLHTALLSQFQWVDVLDSRRLRISCDQERTCFVVVDVLDLSISEMRDADRPLEDPSPELSRLHQQVEHVLSACVETDIPAAIAKCVPDDQPHPPIPSFNS